MFVKFYLDMALPLRFTAIFPGEPGWAVLLKLRMMEVVVTAGVIRRAELRSNRHHQQTNTHYLDRANNKKSTFNLNLMLLREDYWAFNFELTNSRLLQ